MSSVRDRISLLETNNRNKADLEHTGNPESNLHLKIEERRPALPARPNSTGSNVPTAKTRPVVPPRGLTHRFFAQRQPNDALDKSPPSRITLIDLDEALPSPTVDVTLPVSRSPPPRNLLNQVSSNLDQAKRDFDGFSKRTITNAGTTFAAAGNVTKKAFDDSTTVLGEALTPTTLIETKDDTTDLIKRQLGKPGMCSHCRTLPWKSVFTPDPAKEEEYFHWSTPLARVLFHRDWCMACKLFLKMLCQEECDPLRHPDVAPYIEHDHLKRVTMKQFVAEGWADDPKYWPFGRSRERSEGASHYLGPLGEEAGRLAPKMAKVVGLVAVASVAKGTYTVPDFKGHKPSYRDGYRQGKLDERRHPLGCDLSLCIATARSKTPGLMFAELIGFGNRPGGEEKTLSTFTLQAVNNDFTLRYEPGTPLYYGLKLDPEWINVSIGKLWINDCELRHGTRCDHGWSVAEKKPTFLPLIDVDTMTIVEASDPSKSRYICLSYVWGTSTTVKLLRSNLDELTRSGGLRKYMHGLPRTIIDAMEVTRCLGEKYLWVDSLCIMQGNVPESLEQINQMDRVYGSALLTIVAAEGHDANSGLKGVKRKYYPQSGMDNSRSRSLNVPSVQWNSEVCVNAPFPTQQNVAASKWETRAWTFQERLLSRRLLIFAGEEMIWHCRGAIWREDTSVAHSACPTKPLNWLSLKPQYLGVGTDDFWQDGSIERTRHSFTFMVRSGTFAEYANLIEQYTRRQMTYDRDALNAVAGLMQIFTLCFQSEILAGLPAILLDIALLWRPLETLERRTTAETYIPSWSWAGWKGRVKYDETIGIPRDDTSQTMHIEDLRPLLRYFMLNDTTGRLEPINGTARGMPLSDDQLPAEWEVHAPRPGCRDALHSCDTPTLADLDGITISHLDPKHLIFYSSVCDDFLLGRSTKEQNSNNPPYELLDGNGDVVGSITLAGGRLQSNSHNQLKLIVMAEAHTSGLRQRMLNNGFFQYYAVMVVDREPRTGISSRLGIGRVLKVAWVAASPRVELICLG